MSQDMYALLWSFLYVGAVVVVGEWAHRLGLSKEIARKIIHVGVGLWIFSTLALFENRYFAAIPPLTAALGNWIIHRNRLLKAVEAEPDNLGTVWFPISFALLILVAWDRPAAVAGGVSAMTFGDALASLVGVRWGRRGYATFGGARKSLEGSLAMFFGTFVAVFMVLLAFGVVEPVHPYSLMDRSAVLLTLAIAALTAVVATCAEALGVKGRDNLWVPLSAGAVIYVAYDPAHSWVGRVLVSYQAIAPTTVMALGLGAVLASFIGVLAWRRGSLSPSGVLGAILTGTLVFGLGGWTGGLALVGFFVSSSVLSRLFRGRKVQVEEKYAKTGTRDFSQALANGGIAALGAVLFAITGEKAFLGALLGALAAANADTWATELGVLSNSAPRLITNFRPVEPGTSGAISVLGTLAALGGAAFVALTASLTDGSWWAAVPWITAAGFAGALFDSLLGATLQAVYWCPSCAQETERVVHRCGRATVMRRGFPWLGNDSVNFLSTLVGAFLGSIPYFW